MDKNLFDENKKVNELTLDEWIKKETKKREVTFWGSNITIKPEICENIIGDGLQLVYFGTLDQRPEHWLLRIDSKTDINIDDFNIDEEIINPLVEYFGEYPEKEYTKKEFYKERKNNYDLQYYKTYKQYLKEFEYPRMSFSSGYFWGLVVNMVTGEYED